jgi:tetratricopeptide (TPR) repeat protein
MTLAPGTHLGSYEILCKIGAGGMGEVYKAKDPKLGREVAIKVLPTAFAVDAERLRRFQQEARAVSALNHPNILTVHDLGEHEGAPFLVMELLEGQTLRDLMILGPLAAERVAELGEQTAAGLAAAHERGIVHRDLKPENLFLTRDGVLKILDFGLAKRSLLDGFDSTAAMGPATASGTVMGTLSYMSPEQATGKPVGFPSDQFSFGVVLYEMLSGKRPFAGESAAETLAAIVRDDPPPLEDLSPGIPAGLAAIVRQCLAKEPQERYLSTRELAKHLTIARLHVHSGGTAVTGLQPVKVPGKPKPRRLWALTGGSFAVVAVITGLLFWKPGKPAPKPDRIPSVLALPAKVLGSAESAFLADAIPEALSTLLMGVEGLDTKIPPSNLQVEKVQGDLGKIADAYKVQNLVRTTVTAQGENLVLNVQLVEAATQKVRWASQFEGTRATYNQLAKQAAEALVRVLRPGGTGLAVAGSVETSQVELLLQEGRYYVRRYRTRGQVQDYEQARKLYDRALQLSPASSRVLVAVALSYSEKSERDGDLEAVARGEAFARRALEQDPRNGAAWYALAGLEQFKLHPDTRKLYEWSMKALRYAPRDPWAHGAFGSISWFMAECGKQAQEMDPLSINDIGMRATGLIWQGRAAEALPILEKAVAEHPDDPFLVPTKAGALVRLGRLAEAEALLERSRPKPSPMTSFTEDIWNQIQFTWLAAQGKDEATRSRGTELVGRYLDPKTAALNLNNGVIYMAPDLLRLGLREEVLRLLERSLEVGYPPGLIWLSKTPELNPLRGDPRFQKVLQASRELTAVLIQHMETAKAAGELPGYLDQPLAELKRLLDRPTP